MFRQAISIDERRCMFRLKQWDDPQEFLSNPLKRSRDRSETQDILQVWFAGVHGDIGGGYRKRQSQVSKYPLLWMIDEARKSGLDLNTQRSQPARLGPATQERHLQVRRAQLHRRHRTTR